MHVLKTASVQKHYRRFDVTPMPEAGFTLRSEYHLLVGLERTASVMFGGVEGEPAPRQVAVIVGTTEFGEDGTLCFVVDEIQGATPENVMGVRACFVYDKENDTMAPVNDPDGLVMEDCGDDHRLMVQPKPKPESRAT